MATSWRDKAKLSLENRQTETVQTEGTSWKEKARQSLDNRGYVPKTPIDNNEQSAKLKKELATALSGDEFDAQKVRPLVENYAAVQFKIYDDNLKKGHTGIKPIGENISSLFKAHGKSFEEIYPDLSKNFSTGNIEAYAYHTSPAVKDKYNKQFEQAITKDAVIKSFAALNDKREHERNAENIAAEEKEKAAAYNAELERLNGEVDWNSLTPEERLGVLNNNKYTAMKNTGYYNNPVGFSMTPEEAAERKAAADASRDKIYADEALFAARTMRDVMAMPDFEEKSKYVYGSTPTVGYTTTGIDSNMLSMNSFEDVTFDDGSVSSINKMGFTEDQYKVYMYLLNTQGKEAATRFENGIKNTLNSMAAQRMSQEFQKMEKGNILDKAGAAIGQGGYGFASGVEGIGTAFKGIGDTFTGDTEYFMPGIAQQVTAKNKEDASFLGRLALGAVEASPQVLGAAATGAVNPYLGAAFLGATAYGSSYADAKNSGASQAQAIGMGIASAALEIALERVVGNTIEGFGTSLSGKVGGGLSKTQLGKKFISSFDNFAKVHPKRAVALATAGKMFGNSSSEFVEEYLSETASPLLRHVFFGEDGDFTLWSEEQKEAGLIGFLTGAVLEGARGSITLSNLGTDYGIRTEAIKAMSDSSVLKEYKAKFGSDAESANVARAFLLDSERFIASTVAISEYAKEGLSYSEAVEKAKKQGVDISGFEEFAKAAYEIGKTGAVSPAGLSEKLTYKGGAYNDISRLIESGEASDYIADRITSLDKSIAKSEAVKAVNEAKQRAFARSLENTMMSDFEKSNAIKEYVLKEEALDRMYRLGEMGLKFDASMSAGLLSEADAYRAFTRGENARMLSSGQSIEVGSINEIDNVSKTINEAQKNIENKIKERVFEEAPAAPVENDDSEIGSYIDYAIKYGKVMRENPDADMKKQESSKILGEVSERLVNDISGEYGVDLSGKVHALIDNDIRHIINSHGENTNEKYPVTAEDLKQIPDIIENYDDVLYVKRNDGKKGLFYVKQHNGVTYYLESIQDNDNMLRNKQMIKVDTGTIPDLPGLPEAINKKWKQNQSFPDDKIPRMYGFPVRSAVSTTGIITDSSSDVNTVISGMGSYGRALYNKVLEPVAKDAISAKDISAVRSGFANVYEAGQKGENVKRSKAGPLHIKEINAIYEAGKKDAAARANVKKKTDAKIIKDDNFKKANVSKRTERILDGVSKIIGRDIRFSDELEGNAKIDFEKGEIIISTKAKSGHTWAMIHEVYHALVMDSPAEATVLKKTVLDIAKKNPEAYKRFRKKYEITYDSELFDENNKMRIDASEYISEEMVADLVGFTLSEPAILEKLTGQQRNILQKFVDKLVSMFGNEDAAAKEEYFGSRFGGDIRAIFKDVAREADSIAEQFKAALDTSQKAENKKVPDDSGIRYSKNIDEISIKEQISEHKSELSQMNVVASYNYKGKFKNAKEALNWAISTLKNSGYKVDRQNFGTVILDEKRLKNGLAYLDSEAEYIAYALIPKIIKQGIVIGGHSNHKFRGYPTTTFGAPVSINGIRGNMAVVVRTEGKHYYKLHRVVMPNGGVFAYTEKSSDETAAAASNAVDTPTTTTSTSNYTQKNGNVNRNSRDIFTKADEDYMKAVESGDMETAQRMVDEAAKKAGYAVKGYHGTGADFNIFSEDKVGGRNVWGKGFYFGTSKGIADDYASYRESKGGKYRIVSASLKMDSPFTPHKSSLGTAEEILDRWFPDMWQNSRELGIGYVKGKLANSPLDLLQFIAEHNNVEVKDVLAEYGFDSVKDGGELVVFNANQIKSADPVTYDDNGNVIPLSERFNPEKTDIRYSKELFPDDRTMSADEIESEEIEQYIQQIKSSDDLSDADVQAIRQEIIQSRKQQREQLLAEIATTNLKRWGADLGRQEESGKVLSINEAIKKVEESFGVKVTSGGDASVSGKNVSSYNESTRTIRTKFKNDLPAVCHALGYHIDKKLGVVDKVIEQTAEVRSQNGDGEGILEQELKRMVKLEGNDSRKAIKEGFAEFIRMYLVAKNLAQEAAPIFYSEFESMLKEDAELQKAVETSAEVVHGYFAQSGEDRGSAAIMSKKEWDELNRESFGKRAKSKQIKTVQTVTDAAYGIKAVEKSGGVFDLTTSDDAYIRARLTSTSKSRAARLIADDFYDSRGNRIGDSLVEIIKPLGKESSEKFIKFGDYLCFVHALEWIEPYNQDGKKTSSGKDIYKAKAKGHVFKDETLNNADELRKIIAGMETKYPDFKGIAKKVYEYQDRLMEYYLIPSGALSRDQAETFRAQYPHYVPFNRFNTVFGEAIGNGKKNSNLFANLSNPIRKADGGDAPIRHPLESIIDATYKAVVFLDQGEVMAALDRRFTGLGSTPGVMERIYSTKELEKLKEKGENPFSIEEGKTVDENKNPSFNPVVDKEKGIVYRWVNGEKVFYQVYNRDLFNSLVNLNVEELGKIMNNINKVSNLKKKLTTMWNPVFSLSNAIKDFQSFTKNSVTARGAWEYLGPLRSLATYVSSAKSLLSQDEYFKLYKAMGGMDSTRLKSDVYDIQKDIRSIVRKKTKLFSPNEMRELWNYSHHEFFKRIDLIRNTINFVFGINDIVETLPRLSEFKASMKLPESKGDERLAFYRSQDVTVDFSRKGTAGRHINAIFLFSNANLQGIDKMIRNYTEAKYTRKNKNGEFSNATVAKKVLSNLTFDLIMTALIAFCLRDEEDREEYNRLSEFTKNNYYCFHTGDGKFIKIPKGENSMFPQTLTQRLWDASQGDDVDLAELGGYVWDSFMPGFIPNVADFVNTTVNGGGLGEAAIIALNTPFNNTVAAPLTDVLMGYDYKGDKIVSNSMSNYEHNYQKYSYSTSEFSVSFARNLYEKTGIDISPISIDYFINGSGGYYGSATTRLLPDSGGEKTSLGERVWDAVGLERKFTVDARYSTATLDRFYNDRDAAKKTADRKPAAKNLMVNEKYQTMSSLMSDYNKVSRLGNEEQQRLDRKMLQVILEGFDEGEFTEGEKYVMSLYDATGNDDVFVSSFPGAELRSTKTEKGKKIITEVTLDANLYVEYCAEISRMREAVRVLIRDLGLDETAAAELLAKEYKNINADIKEKYLEKYGVTSEVKAEKKEVKFDERAYKKAYEAELDKLINN